MAKILLAEDDLTMVSLLKTLLKMEGFEVVTLDADADVPAAVRRESPDVLLMDVHLSHQSGLDILRTIRRKKDTANLRVIMTSGSNVKEECQRAGADDFLLKPYMPDELIGMLNQTINSSR
jgi:DNA-binding response OmpR family regulator